jgi:hypothetical protein
MIAMSTFNKSQLVTINLKFGSHAKPLRQVAFADLASNALLFLKKDVSTTEIAKEMSRLLGLPGIDETLVAEALNALRIENKAQQSSGKWHLADDARKAMELESEDSEKTLREVLVRHFPGNIDPVILRDWFLSASSDFFGFNGAEWVKSISRNTSSHFAKPQTTKELLIKSIKKYKLETHENDLINAYYEFLTSEDLSDRQYIMTLGFAMFSAQLVSADTGADPITIDEIRGSTFILDTNALFAFQLDAHRLARSIAALEIALTEINAELVFLEPTDKEYRRVYTGKKGEITALFRDFPDEVVLDAKSDFIESGISRGCKNGGDFETFFETIRNPPPELPAGLKVIKKDDLGIDAEIKKAEGDIGLKNAIQKHCLKLRGKWDKRPKSESALKHDAALVRVTELLRKQKPKTWILSLDRGLHSATAERAGAHGVPAVFMLDGLIQILAVHSGGPSRNAADFAPLLTSILLNRCSPSEKTYTTQDLSWLYAIQQRVADFSPEDIKKIVGIITQHRLAGATASDHKLQIAVNRAYQDKKREYSREIEEARERAYGAETEAEGAKKKLASVQKDLGQLKSAECIRRKWKEFAWKLSWRIPLSVIIAIVVYFLAKWSMPAEKKDLLNWITSIFTFTGIFAWLLIKPIRTLIEGCKICKTSLESR